MNSPNPALVSQREAEPLPRLALIILSAAYVLPGLLGRDPWKSADITAFGYMVNIANGQTPWLAPTVSNTAPGAPKPSPSKTVFALQNPQGLEAHIGHRVQVRGVVAPATANLPPSPDTIAARGFTGVPQPTFPGPAAVPRLAPPSLDNKDVRMIAARCSQGRKPTRQAAKSNQALR